MKWPIEVLPFVRVSLKPGAVESLDLPLGTRGPSRFWLYVFRCDNDMTITIRDTQGINREVFKRENVGGDPLLTFREEITDLLNHLGENKICVYAKNGPKSSPEDTFNPYRFHFKITAQDIGPPFQERTYFQKCWTSRPHTGPHDKVIVDNQWFTMPNQTDTVDGCPPGE